MNSQKYKTIPILYVCHIMFEKKRKEKSIANNIIIRSDYVGIILFIDWFVIMAKRKKLS